MGIATTVVPPGQMAGGHWVPLRLATARRMWLDIQRVEWFEPRQAEPLQGAARRDRKIATTSAEELLAFADGDDPANLGAFILHIGKSGSTLLRNMLDSHPDIRALLEPPILTQILCWFTEDNHDVERERLLRATINAHAGAACATGRQLVIKFSSVCVAGLACLRRLYPTVPVLMVIREPRSLIAAHLRSPVLWGEMRTLDPALIRGCRPQLDRLTQQICGMTWDIACGLSNEAFIARTIGHYYHTVLAIDDPRVVPFAYEGLRNPKILRAVLSMCRVDVTDEAVASMLALGAHHAKNPSQPYDDDADAGADSTTRAGLIRDWVAEPYDRLVQRSAKMFAANVE